MSIRKTYKKRKYFENQTIIEKRTGSDIWKNMYQFPLSETDSEKSTGKPVFVTRETLSHQVIHAAFYVKNVKKLPKISENQQIVNFDDIENYPMPKIMTLFLKHV